jgi:hypothetical protein
VIWLVGLYLLFSRGYFFPGILILLAISALYEGLLARFAPHAFEYENPNVPATGPAIAGASVDKSIELTGGLPANQEHRLDLLPQACPSCNGPIRGHEVRWTGSRSANCPYCGTNLPVKQV